MQKILIGLLLLFVLQNCQQPKSKYIYNEGYIYGTFYHISYSSPKGIDLQAIISEGLNLSDLSLSTFKPQSIISKVNKNEAVVLDDLFVRVFEKAKEISKITNGAFDVTVMPLVNLWGFGFKKEEEVTARKIDSIKTFVGYDKVRLSYGKVEKDDLRTTLDFSAIAKGFGVDLVAKLLEDQGCENYMVEIGGEVVAKGVNREGRIWRIGINEPNDNEPIEPTSLQAVVELKNKALATSGNYRNFYIKDGKKYAHTINPETGYPVQHSLLSATVLANDCMTADAFATSFMVMGVDKAMELAERISGLEAFFIYAGNNGEHLVKQTKGFEQYLLN